MSATNNKRRKAKQISALDHAKRKSMWVGSKDLQTVEMYVRKANCFENTKLKFAPAWYKIIDEIIVNAIDQWVTYPHKVKKIDISFEKATGVVIVSNSGPSIGVYMTKNLAGTPMYAAQLIASEFLSGDNLDEDDDSDRTTGGTNGAGLKLTNAFSEYLTLTTVDTEVKKSYSQTFRNRLTIIEPPVIADSIAKSFTQIEFMPCYKVFGYKQGYTDALYNDLSSLIEARAYQAAVFTNAVVQYNGTVIDIPDHNPVGAPARISAVAKKFCGFAGMFLGGSNLYYTRLIDVKSRKFPWDVAIGASDGKFRQVSIINGIYVKSGGSHIKHIQNQIVTHLKAKVVALIKKAKVKFNPNYIINNLFVFVRCSIVKPQFSSQIKFELNDPVEKFEPYKFRAKDWVGIWQLLENHIMAMFLEKYRDTKKTRVIRGHINVPKCRDAKFAGHKTKSAKCTLIICEGDSAMGTVHEGITSKHTELSYDYYGTFSIQGVPMNARKEISIYVDKKTKTQTIIRTAKLQNNERLTSVVKVLGLDYDKTYAMTPAGDAEFATLRYAKTTAAVDQDDDGKGNILGLWINFVVLFWPALAKRGFITRFSTPIIRAYPKNKRSFVEEFESLATFDAWVAEKFGGHEEKVLSKFALKYYKGLGSHRKNEVPHMFREFEKRLCIYQLDDDAQSKLETYFGTNTAPRKHELSTPVTRPETIAQNIDITEQLDRDLKAYQRDNIMRKLPHLMDGSVPSRRKVIFTARSVFANTNAEMKVNAFVNETSKTTHYHHGETSLAGTVTKMAQDFPGARHLPFLRPQGQFGTRSNGGKDAASPRYTFTQLTKRLCFAMFPREDDCLLKYTFDDGVRCEPEYYCPIVPLSILEHMEIPATGWKVKLWARDFTQVIANVRGLISGELTAAKPMSPWMAHNKGTLRKCGTRLYSVGVYVYDEDKKEILVTELPLGKYSAGFIGDPSSKNPRHLCNKAPFSDPPEDMTNDDSVNITFSLTSTGWDEISEHGNESFDCVEDFMNLTTSLDSNINMISIDGSVQEFKKYEDVINAWYPERKEMYADRIDRQIILAELHITFLQNVIKFTKNHQKYKITSKTTLDQVMKILAKHKFDRFNAALLNKPKYTTNTDLARLIINHKYADYDYLIRLSYRDMIDSACAKRVIDLASWTDRLKIAQKDLGDASGNHFKGRDTWLAELSELETVVTAGMRDGWSFGGDAARYRPKHR
jgi:DNA topoisomerase-2